MEIEDWDWRNRNNRNHMALYLMHVLMVNSQSECIVPRRAVGADEAAAADSLTIWNETFCVE